MLLERMGGTVTLERPDGTTEDVKHVLWYDASSSDQSVMDVQTRFINQARYKGDSKTLTILWPKSAPHDIMDCHVWVRGERFRVYANPAPPSGTPLFVGYDMFVTANASLFLYDAELLRPTSTRDQWGVLHTEWEPTPTKVNLLRLSDDLAHSFRQDGMGRITLLELPPDTWDEEYTAFRMGGHEHTITSIDYAEDVVVIAGMEVVGSEVEAATPDPGGDP